MRYTSDTTEEIRAASFWNMAIRSVKSVLAETWYQTPPVWRAIC
jgi:hypothetical protein